MGYPQGEIPMRTCTASAVAGATFPVPIWHEYMAAALWHHKVLGFPTPDKYPSYSYFTKGDWGARSVLRAALTTTTTTTTTPRRRRPQADAAATRPTLGPRAAHATARRARCATRAR